MKRKTNVEFVTDMMEYSEQGALIQAFILYAIEEYAKGVLKSDAQWDNGLINSEVWRACAQEVLGKFVARSAA